MARFLVYLEPAEEGGYIVSAPALPGCVTQGETKEEALAMIKDAISGYIASLRKHGEPLPANYEAAEFEVVEVKVGNVAWADCPPSNLIAWRPWRLSARRD
ncbi:MAG TPA: type II toxin-antitoxin system HicB family antitoxin [Blastocatellia bacterium]|nr:type II toxin-antitoxin system HicB family antitoxin [Blastocatellia bacterium]